MRRRLAWLGACALLGVALLAWRSLDPAPPGVASDVAGPRPQDAAPPALRGHGMRGAAETPAATIRVHVLAHGTGAPLEGATLWCLPPAEMSPPATPRVTHVRRDDVRWSMAVEGGVAVLPLERLGPLPVRLVASAPGRAPGAQVIEAVDSAHARADCVLALRACPVIHVIVLTPGGEPVPGIEVVATAIGLPEVAHQEGVPGPDPRQQSARSDASGRITLAAPPGPARLHVTTPGWVEVAYAMGRTETGQPGALHDGWGVVAQAGDTIELRVGQAGVVALAVRDEAGLPIPTVVHVSVDRTQLGSMPLPTAQGWLHPTAASTDAEGRFVRTVLAVTGDGRLAAETVDAVVDAPGYRTGGVRARVQRPWLDGEPIAVDVVVLRREAPLETVTLDLHFERALPEGCYPSDRCRLSYFTPHTFGFIHAGSRQPADARGHDVWRFRGVPTSATQLRVDDGYSVSDILDVDLGRGDVAQAIAMPPPAGMAVHARADDEATVDRLHATRTLDMSKVEMRAVLRGGGSGPAQAWGVPTEMTQVLLPVPRVLPRAPPPSGGAPRMFFATAGGDLTFGFWSPGRPPLQQRVAIPPYGVAYVDIDLPASTAREPPDAMDPP